MDILGATVFRDARDVPPELYNHFHITLGIPYDVEVLLQCLNIVPGMIVSSGKIGYIVTLSFTQVKTLVVQLCTKEQTANVRRFGNELYYALPKLKNLLNTCRRDLADGTFILQSSL